MTDPRTTTDYLYALRNRGSQYGIARMQRFVAALGDPQLKFPVIHIAGTNGKGSVCAMLEALYRNNGYKTGLFTSPHLVHLGERVQVDRQPLSMDEIAHYTRRLRAVAEDLERESPGSHPTFFEFMAAMAFLHFAESGIDIAVIETGLGGRLDATNVVDPELCIITSISLDHTDLLGETLPEIAREKAGILKPGKPVLIGRLPEDAELVMGETATRLGCPLHALDQCFSSSADLPKTNLFGAFQRINAGLALQATEILSRHFPIRSTSALQQVDWPGRWQTLQVSGRRVILDATHNPEGATQLAESLASLKEKPIIITGTLGEERGRSLMQAIIPFAQELHFVEPNQPRAVSSAFLRSCLPSDAPLPVHAKQLDALFSENECFLGQPGDTIVCTGSIYLIGEILQLLQGVSSTSASNLQDKMSPAQTKLP